LICKGKNSVNEKKITMQIFKNMETSAHMMNGWFVKNTGTLFDYLKFLNVRARKAK
jgi:hypothetical protein